MDNEKLSKLPKWAQSEIKRLESNLIEVENELSTLYGKNETNTKIAYVGNDKPLPNSAVINFDIGGNVISCNIVDGELRIYGRNGISVFPKASNSVYIK